MATSLQTETSTDTPDALIGLDRQLVDLLQDDGRASYADLGDHVGLSGDAVRERLKRLEGNGQIRIVGSVSSTVLGCTSFALIAIRAQGPSRQAARLLAEIPAIDLVVCVAGRYDVLAQVVCHDDNELLSVIDDQIRTIDSVAVEEVFSYLTVEKYSAGFDKGVALPSATPPVAVDSADHALITALQADGRASYRELQEASGLSYTSTRRRVRALLDSGLVRIVTIENELSLGARVQAAVGIQINGPIQPVHEALLEIPEVEVAVTAVGSFDLLLEVTCADKTTLAALTGDRLRRVNGIVRSQTFQYLDVIKLPYTWANLQHTRLGQ